MFNSSSPIQAFAFLLTLLSSSYLPAADKPPEILTRSIKVVDPQGQPVAGAFANAWLINEKFFWPTQIVPNKEVKTGQDGIAQLQYPKDASLSTKDLPVESIKLTVSHADFLSVDVVVPVATAQDKPFEIQLKPGVSVTISAVDEGGRPLTEPFAVMTTAMNTAPRWHRPAPDIAQGSSMSNGNHQLMLVQPNKDGQDRFSSVMTYRFNLAKEPKVVMEEIELLPGISVKGKLQAEVPRPVKNGHVIAVCIPLPAGDSWDEKVPSLLYYHSANLREDGTFEFTSLPTTGTIQLISLCDGWVGLQDKSTPFIVGETFEVDDKPLDVELKMERTFDAKIRVVDQSMQPIEGITVACSPNQMFKKGGSTWLGERFDSLPQLRSQLGDEPWTAPNNMQNAFQAESDKQGRLVIRNLPRNRYSARFVAWASPKAGVKIEALSDGVAGKLPDKDQNEVEFDITVKVLK